MGYGDWPTMSANVIGFDPAAPGGDRTVTSLRVAAPLTSPSVKDFIDGKPITFDDGVGKYVDFDPTPADSRAIITRFEYPNPPDMSEITRLVENSVAELRRRQNDAVEKYLRAHPTVAAFRKLRRERYLSLRSPPHPFNSLTQLEEPRTSQRAWQMAFNYALNLTHDEMSRVLNEVEAVRESFRFVVGKSGDE